MDQAHHPFVIEEGHEYSFPNVGSGMQAQSLRFIRRHTAARNDPENDHPGTNVQSVLRVLIDRTFDLEADLPCVENGDAIYYLRMALLCYEGRAWRRKVDKVNREAPEHTSFRERDRDLPFTDLGFRYGDQVGIENLAVGPDGHIIVP